MVIERYPYQPFEKIYNILLKSAETPYTYFWGGVRTTKYTKLYFLVMVVFCGRLYILLVISQIDQTSLFPIVFLSCVWCPSGKKLFEIRHFNIQGHFWLYYLFPETFILVIPGKYCSLLLIVCVLTIDMNVYLQQKLTNY